MASNVFVIDASFKRTQIKVTPGKYLREILEEACASRKVDPEQYTLKHNNKALDLSQPYRLAGLSGGAKLSLTKASRSPSVVNVALQLPESEGGTRLQDKFPSTTSIWHVLRRFEEGVAGQAAKKLNVTQRGVASTDVGAGRLYYEQPCLHLSGRNLESFADLQKTLGQLGLSSGSILMRLTYKNSGQPLEEAMREITERFKSADGENAVGGSTENGASKLPVEDTVMSEDVSQEPSKDGTEENHTEIPMSVDSTAAPSTEQASSDPSSTSIPNISVYLPPSTATPVAALLPHDPSTYEPTIAHAKSHQAALTRSTANTRLASDAELASAATNRAAALAAVSEIKIRVRYPDQSQVETTFGPAATSRELYGVVRAALMSEDEPFELRMGGAKGFEVLNESDRSLIRDLKLRGRVLVIMAWKPNASAEARSGPCLKDEYRAAAKELKVDLVGSGPEADEEDEKDKNVGKGKAPEKSGKKGGGDVEAKMKKFLGFGRK